MLFKVLTFTVGWLFIVGGIEVDPKGYIVYCPCMGRFGNQADHFLGVLAFAKNLDRTLILPPWVEYNFPKPRSDQIPFDKYFKVEPLSEFHRVITMEKFMKELAPSIWPEGKRISFCYSSRPGASNNGCNAKDGNPFGPFWDTFNIEFDKSEFFGPLSFDTRSRNEVDRWNKRYPTSQYPVLAFTGAPAHFPVEERNVGLHKYLKWSSAIESQADKLISEKFNNNRFLGIHLRLGSDFSNACRHVGESPMLFASAQCIGYRGEKGKLTANMCYPPDKLIIMQVKNAIKKLKLKHVFVATDSRDLIKKFKKSMPEVTFAKQETSGPHVDLAILGKAEHYIGNCVSTFSAFAKRERDGNGKTTEFWAFNEDLHDEL